MARIDPQEFLNRKCPDRKATTFVYALDELGLSPAESARMAGYSHGRSDDPKKQNAYLSSAASRAIKTRRVQRLREQLAVWRRKQRGDDEPDIASVEEVLRTLTRVMRSSKDAAVVQSATKLLDAFKRGAMQSKPGPEDVRKLVDRLCGREQLILQIAGIEYGLFYRHLPCMQGWEVPESLKPVERYLNSKMTPLEALAIIEGREK
jgi:hypothetical protein